MPDTVTLALRTQPSRAADLMASLGWAQNADCSARGEVCLTGALRRVTEHPADWLLARAVFQRLGRAERWNDSPGVDEALVQATLRAVEITPDLLRTTFGPQWEQVVALVRVVATLTPEQHVALRLPWSRALADAATRADRAARAAGRGTELAAAKASVWDAARAAGGAGIADVAASSAGTTCWDAVTALVVADLDTVTDADRTTLTAAWTSVMGAVHPL